jgi:hemerythrin-like metal-binding protein
MLPRIVIWSEEIETGVHWYDTQHRQLLATVFRLYKTLRDGFEPRILGEVLPPIERFLYEHMPQEEAYMMRAGYPQQRDHAAEHQCLQEGYGRLKDCLDARCEDPQACAQRLYEHLIGCFEHHIREADTAFGRYLHQRARG